ncbi:MAG: hypothetical protein HYX67_02805 [Candidatus Melainabacteria bacterium]|nr:hypothetical protein [Candidatus Melainabacteria bacterium]
MASTSNLAPARHSIALEDLHIDFFTHNQSFHSWLSSYYEPHLNSDQDSSSSLPENDYSITLEALGSPHELTLPEIKESLFTKFCLIADSHCYFRDGKFTSRAEGELLEIDVNARTVRGNLGGVFLESEESFIYVVVRDILRRLVLPLSGYVMLHGSVVTRGDQTIFFAGDKAMGKSTVALEMLKHGYKIISDDSPIAALTAGGAHVLSGRDQLSVTANTLRLFPELQDCVSRQRDVSGKYFLDRNKLGSARVTSEARRITDFVQLNRGAHEKCVLKPIDKGIASANLVREFMPLFRKELALEKNAFFFRDKNQIMFQILSCLLSGARAHELNYSDAHRSELPAILCALSTNKK